MCVLYMVWILLLVIKIEAKLRSLQNSSNWEEFMGRLKETATEVTTVTEMATLRLQVSVSLFQTASSYHQMALYSSQDMKSTAAQQLMVEAQAELSKCNRMLVSTTKVGMGRWRSSEKQLKIVGLLFPGVSSTSSC